MIKVSFLYMFLAAPPSTSSASPAPQVQFSAGLAAEEMATVADWRQFQVNAITS